MSQYHPHDLPLVLVASYVVGYVAGHSFAVLWTSGAASKRGVDRVAHGVTELVSRRLLPQAPELHQPLPWAA